MRERTMPTELSSDGQAPRQLHPGKPGTLYLLAELGGEAFKIGIAYDTYRRATALPVKIAFSCSYEVPVPEGDARAVEKLLHYLFRDCRVPKGAGDGRTEWFSLNALPQVLAFLAQHRSSLGIGEPQALRAPSVKPPRKSAREPRTTTQAEMDGSRAWAAAWNRGLLRELRAILNKSAVVGIVQPESGKGSVILQGPKRDRLLSRLIQLRPAHCYTGWMPFPKRLFTDAFSLEPYSRAEIATALVTDELMSEQGGHIYPEIDNLRHFIISRLSEDERLRAIDLQLKQSAQKLWDAACDFPFP
jgi:hypothetical protein